MYAVQNVENAHANDFYCENVGFMFNWELC